MIVCSCNAVNAQTVRAAIASGAETIEEIGLRCRAGATCGGCHPTLERMLGEVAVALRTQRHTAA